MHKDHLYPLEDRLEKLSQEGQFNLLWSIIPGITCVDMTQLYIINKSNTRAAY